MGNEVRQALQIFCRYCKVTGSSHSVSKVQQSVGEGLGGPLQNRGAEDNG